MLAFLSAIAFFLGGLRVDDLGTFSWLYLGLFLLALHLAFSGVLVGLWQGQRRQP